jgi:hypothetical protein
MVGWFPLKCMGCTIAAIGVLLGYKHEDQSGYKESVPTETLDTLFV